MPAEIEDRYVKEVLYNTSLQNLPDEEWKLIENFETYAISNYGRIKSRERWITDLRGRKRKVPDRIMRLQFMKFFNKYLNDNFYNITALLSSEGKRYRRSIPRLVYYHFVEKFDLNNDSDLISFKDNNRFHIHADNLEKLTVSEELYKRVRTDRSKNSRSTYERPVSQYTVEGDLVNHYERIDAAASTLEISGRYILAVIHNERFTAGGFRWFFKDYIPKKADFILSPENNSDTSTKLLNKSLWEKLGKPPIDQNNPPACVNLSLNDLPNEHWKPIPGFENQYVISNKGRLKRLGSWTTSKNKTYWREQIMAINVLGKYGDKNHNLYVPVVRKDNRTLFIISRLLYYCFVEEFDMTDKRLIVVNENKLPWDMDLSKLKLKSRISLLKPNQFRKTETLNN